MTRTSPLPKEWPTPVVVWFTGLSGAGKSTIAARVAEALDCAGARVDYLDGDAIRSAFPQTGFSREERDTHARRVGFLASRLETHGVNVIVALISPYRGSRDFVRGLCKNFIEVHVSTPLPVCECRDVKGLYAKVRRGEITSFTGIDDPYEPPVDPEVTLDTTDISVDVAVRLVLDAIARRRLQPRAAGRLIAFRG